MTLNEAENSGYILPYDRVIVRIYHKNIQSSTPCVLDTRVSSSSSSNTSDIILRVDADSSSSSSKVEGEGLLLQKRKVDDEITGEKEEENRETQDERVVKVKRESIPLIPTMDTNDKTKNDNMNQYSNDDDSNINNSNEIDDGDNDNKEQQFYNIIENSIQKYETKPITRSTTNTNTNTNTTTVAVPTAANRKKKILSKTNKSKKLKPKKTSTNVKIRNMLIRSSAMGDQKIKDKDRFYLEVFVVKVDGYYGDKGNTIPPPPTSSSSSLTVNVTASHYAFVSVWEDIRDAMKSAVFAIGGGNVVDGKESFSLKNVLVRRQRKKGEEVLLVGLELGTGKSKTKGEIDVSYHSILSLQKESNEENNSHVDNGNDNNGVECCKPWRIRDVEELKLVEQFDAVVIVLN